MMDGWVENKARIEKEDKRREGERKRSGYIYTGIDMVALNKC
jgi:hypothetical protein